MRKAFLILFSLYCWACVGQKDDPEPLPVLPDPLAEVTPEPGPKEPQQPEETPGGPFFHRVLALEFTGTWCQYCPNMAQALLKAQELRPGRLVEIAVHAYDDFSPAASDPLVQLFGVGSFPTMVLDWDAATLFTSQDPNLMVQYVDATVGEETCGLALSCADGTLVVKVCAAEPGSYTLVVAQVEDGLVARQAGYGEGYVNQAVLRGFLGDGYTGNSLGELAEGEEATRSFNVELTENQRFVAFILKDGRCRNVRSCADGETLDYAYEEAS